MHLTRLWRIAAGLLVVAGSLAATPGVVVDRDGVVPAPPMGAHRAAHTATALPDGTVLVAGGFVEKGSAVGAELFEPAQRRFRPLPPMQTTRHSHSATLLRDGRVLLVGGYGAGGATLGSAEVFDPRGGRFAPAGALLEPRADHVAVPLDDGRVLIAGGLGQGWTFLKTAEVFDPATGRFTPTGAMHVAREGHAGLRLPDGHVLIVGGHTGRRADVVVHASAETFDPRSGRFTRVGDLGIPRHKHDVLLLADGRVMVTGGADQRDADGVYDSTEFFDVRQRTFSAGPRLALPRYKHAGTSLLLPDGRVLIAGGAARPELFDPVMGRFAVVSGLADMPGSFSAVAPLPGGGALVTGGYGRGRGPTQQTWRYIP